jgi:hypothetical protein
MECPSCRSSASTTTARVDHLYGDLLPGIPTFWPFMAPTVARAATTAIGGVAITLWLVGVVWIARGWLMLGMSVGLVAVFATFVFMRCRAALGQHHVKLQFRCSACAIEWSRADGPGWGQGVYEWSLRNDRTSRR